MRKSCSSTALPFLRPAVIVALLLAATVPAQAQWKWRDKGGQITASDLPPPREVPEKDILQRPDASAARRPAVVTASAPASAAAPGVTVARPVVDKELEARKRAGEQEQQAKAKVDEDRLAGQRAENCRRARGHLAALETGQRVARTNEKGEREILDDKGRAEEMRRTSEVVGADCK